MLNPGVLAAAGGEVLEDKLGALGLAGPGLPGDLGGKKSEHFEKSKSKVSPTYSGPLNYSSSADRRRQLQRRDVEAPVVLFIIFCQKYQSSPRSSSWRCTSGTSSPCR